ncbi:MAG: hypothetical protein PHD61_01985 [Bacteroidales bacterium]|nr:hypothetical protein [Bacteroidales bacterium]
MRAFVLLQQNLLDFLLKILFNHRISDLGWCGAPASMNLAGAIERSETAPGAVALRWFGPAAGERSDKSDHPG